jgi:hypothetical protein
MSTQCAQMGRLATKLSHRPDSYRGAVSNDTGGMIAIPNPGTYKGRN